MNEPGAIQPDSPVVPQPGEAPHLPRQHQLPPPLPPAQQLNHLQNVPFPRPDPAYPLRPANTYPLRPANQYQLRPNNPPINNVNIFPEAYRLPQQSNPNQPRLPSQPAIPPQPYSLPPQFPHPRDNIINIPPPPPPPPPPALAIMPIANDGNEEGKCTACLRKANDIAGKILWILFFPLSLLMMFTYGYAAMALFF